MRFPQFRRLAPLAILFAVAACDMSTVGWLDSEPITTSQPSPLASSPIELPDTTLRSGDSMAAFVETQDLLRDAGGESLLEAHFAGFGAGLAAGEGAGAGDSGAPGAPASDAGVSVAAPQQSGPAPEAAAPANDAAPAFPGDPERCVGSLRLAHGPGGATAATWWSRRGGGRVALMTAWKGENTAALWSTPVAVDTSDTGPSDARAGERRAAGCNRIPPAIAVDAATGAVHIAYSLPTKAGAGVFHVSQSAPGGPFGAPQAIVHGDAPAAARIAAAGELVAIAYEDPNGGTRRGIVLALSHDSGAHFKDRLAATAGVQGGRDPYVMIRGDHIVVGWSEIPNATATPVFKVRRAQFKK